MKIQNIERVLVFNEDHSHELTLEELERKFGFEPDGTNMYYGVNEVNLGNYKGTGPALSFAHRQVIDALQSSLSRIAAKEKTLVFGFEPSQLPHPYDSLSNNLDLVRQLAVDLNAQQQKTRNNGKELRISIRYASEMNDHFSNSQPQSGNPEGYKSTFARVRPIFSEHAPNIMFSFSPALRAPTCRNPRLHSTGLAINT